MRTCGICGQDRPEMVLPGCARCLDCMSDWEIEQMDLSAVAAEMDAELEDLEARTNWQGLLNGGDPSETDVVGMVD